MVKMDKILVRSRLKMSIVRSSLIYSFLCTAIMTWCTICAVINGGTITMNFNYFNEMYIELVVVPLAMIVTLISVSILWKKLNIEYNSSCYELSNFYKRKSNERKQK